MALAAYGKPVHVDLMLDELLNKKGHRIRLNMDWFDFNHSTQRSYGEKFIHTFGEPIDIRKIQSSAGYDFKRAADLAKSAQVVVESVIKELIDWGLANHTCDAITITGGVAHNSLAIQAVCDYASVTFLLRYRHLPAIQVPQSVQLFMATYFNRKIISPPKRFSLASINQNKIKS